jgi:AbrB family looped-hinge helix DNA binding protein
MFHDNLIQLRKLKQLTQEDVAEAVGVSRQAVAKWESGETMPDLGKCKALAELFDVSLDDLANYEPEQNMQLGVPPKGKHLFGVVTVGEKGQIIIPAKARKLFSINAGDQLVVLGEDGQGMALIKANDFLFMADAIRKKEMNMDEI